ncbi:probable manganese-transporting ATPase PDR2 [Euphorbia lathyris]|uniref:probable manganese-transporting ATPase PDR2 n=1 Tax=Euphorbia lathyris TaxID=212925 RepID=UPI003313A3AF
MNLVFTTERVIFHNLKWMLMKFNFIVGMHCSFRLVKLSGTDLLPGDVVSIGCSSGPNGEDKSVPTAGSAIVNEAILTGESTPQWKVSVMGRGTEEKLSAKRDKSHVLFGGTKILQHAPDKTFPLRTPDGGCCSANWI